MVEATTASIANARFQTLIEWLAGLEKSMCSGIALLSAQAGLAMDKASVLVSWSDSIIGASWDRSKVCNDMQITVGFAQRCRRRLGAVGHGQVACN